MAHNTDEANARFCEAWNATNARWRAHEAPRPPTKAQEKETKDE